ncbi:hypothetical protein ACJMK2_014689 [Sinanodonta woodiana]|uniref:Uncharacterized protein n=1 Tax=Sinanodonta woodiana TaxID=1069815 RepID=A0ABD3V4I8_SINWO
MKRVKASDLAAISVIVSDALYVGGTNSYGTQLSKNKAIIAYELAQCPSHESSVFILGGSHAEGTTLDDSDSDGMRVVPNVTICTERKDAKHIEGHVLLMDSRKCRPGFIRLVPVDIKDDTSYFAGIVRNTEGLFQSNIDGGTYMSSQRFIDALVSSHKRKLQDMVHYRHGPCATSAQHLRDYNISNVESDVAYALRICTWPSEADEWTSRARHYSWPSPETINKIRQHDCHAVAVGDPTSEFSALEWRISFLLGERELVWSFNDTQIQCYYILKYLLKEYIDKQAPGQLSSYHMKTLMFWQCEESDSCIWNGLSLLSCVKKCLEKLRDYIERKELQHFFDRKRNLLFSKFENVEEKDRVVGQIEVLLDDIVSPVMQSITEKILVNAWNEAENLESFYDAADRIDLGRIKEEASRIKLYKTLYNTFVLLTRANPDLQFLIQGLDRCVLDRTLDRTFVESVEYFLSIQLGIHFSQHAQIIIDIHEKQNLLKKAQTLLERGSCMDSMSAILHLATFHFSNGNCNTTSSLIENMLKFFNVKKPYYAGVMSKPYAIQIDDIGYAKETIWTLSYTGELTQSVAYDVIVSSRHISVMPYAIQFECILLKDRLIDVCLYHPIIYAFYMLSMSKRLEGKYTESVKALQCLEKATHDFYAHVKGLQVPRHRALNLLGYCYFSIGEYARALHYYKRSLEDFSSPRNAAVYHLIIMAFVMLDNQIVYERKGNVGY